MLHNKFGEPIGALRTGARRSKSAPHPVDDLPAEVLAEMRDVFAGVTLTLSLRAAAARRKAESERTDG
jgi:hypothetical protein